MVEVKLRFALWWDAQATLLRNKHPARFPYSCCDISSLHPHNLLATSYPHIPPL